VAPGGSDSADGSAQHPWATIQYAADAVVAGDMVHVAPGTYKGAISSDASGTSSARIVFVSDTKWGAKIRTTGVDTAWNNDGDYVSIQGFDVSGDGRTGILNNGSYGFITGNYVHDIPANNTGSNGGSGINTGDYGSSGTVIMDNRVQRIGNYTNPDDSHSVQGIYISNAKVTVQNNIVGQIEAYGIHCWHAAVGGTITNNVVFASGASGVVVGDGDSPGGVVADNFVVSNNILLKNTDYGINNSGSVGTHNQYLNNCISGNGRGDTDLDSGNTATGTVTADPQFVNFQLDGTGDYHLKAGSPCIDAGIQTGAPTTDMDGTPRPQAGGYDIGAYEQ